MYKFIVMILSMVFFDATAFSDSRWTSFRTNIPDVDDIRGISIEGNTVWCATRGYIVKWGTDTGLYSLMRPENVNYKYYDFRCMGIDWDGTKWFGVAKGDSLGGSYGCVVSLKDTVWTVFSKTNTPILNLYTPNVSNISAMAIDSKNKRIVFGLYYTFYIGQGSSATDSFYSFIEYNGVEWKEIININADEYVWIFPLFADTIDPGIIWHGQFGMFKKNQMGIYENINITNALEIDYPNTGSNYSIAIDKDNTVWITGVNIYQYDRTKFIKYSPETTGALGNVRTVAIDRNGVKWFGADESLIRYDGVTWESYPFMKESVADYVSALAVDDHGDVWMGRGSYFSKNGYGLWRFHPTPTGVKEASEKPQSIKIIGNTPNPFNPSTSIAFTVAEPGNVELAVYAVTGQHVRTLVSRTMSAGTHEIVWDGRDDNGQPVSSGVYLSRLAAGKSVATGRMALVK